MIIISYGFTLFKASRTLFVSYLDDGRKVAFWPEMEHSEITSISAISVYTCSIENAPKYLESIQGKEERAI